MRAILPLLLLIVVAATPLVNGFVQNGRNSRIPAAPGHVTPRQQCADAAATFSPSALHMANPIAAVGKAVAPLLSSPSTSLVKKVLLLLFSASLILTKQYKRILWPGSGPDKTVSEPLPPSAMGCPLFGYANAFAGTKEHGPFAVIAKLAKKFGNPSIFRFYTFGMPLTSVSGLDNIKTTLRHEFEEGGINTLPMTQNFKEIFGGKSVLYEGDKKHHGALRRLVGSALNPAAVSSAIPAIQAVAEKQVGVILENEGKPVKMEDVVTDFTLYIAHRQILGLDLKDGEEVDEFHKYTEYWLQGIMSPVLLLPFRYPFLKWTKGYRGHGYLVSKVEEKLERLEKEGPDDSTLSKMYFATDDDGMKLTHEEVIDNSLILIVAGSETSSSTLTVALLLLGLHPDVWRKVKAEQKKLRSNYGDSLTKEQLDECTYLDAVVKETMRIRPIDGMELRKTEETIVVDGKQIPKGSYVYANVRQTHANDAATFMEDGSHMDVKQGFDPDRWMDPARKPSVFMGFGEGGRRCLGERLAMTEMKIFLATLARKVDFDLVRSADDEVLWNKDEFMSRPIDGTEIIPRAAEAVKLEA